MFQSRKDSCFLRPRTRNVFALNAGAAAKKRAPVPEMLWCITHIFKLVFFLLLLSFNGSPNSKLSRFFSSVVLFLFFFFSLLVFVSFVQFISIPQIHEIVSLLRHSDMRVCVCARRTQRYTENVFFYHHHSPKKFPPRATAGRAAHWKSCSRCPIVECVLFPKWSCRESAIYIITWRHRYLYWLRSSSCCCSVFFLFFCSMCLGFKSEEQKYTQVARTQAHGRHQAGDVEKKQQSKKSLFHVTFFYVFCCCSFSVYISPFAAI